MRVLLLRWTTQPTYSVPRCRLPRRSGTQVSPVGHLHPLGISLWHNRQFTFQSCICREHYPSVVWGLHPSAWTLSHWTAFLCQSLGMMPWYPQKAHHVCSSLSMLRGLCYSWWLLHRWQTAPLYCRTVYHSVVPSIQPHLIAVPQLPIQHSFACNWVVKLHGTLLASHSHPCWVCKSQHHWLASRLLDGILC